MKYTIHDKINANTCLKTWRCAPERTTKERYMKRMMIEFFMNIKRS